MPELWARAPDATNRKFRELYSADGGGANRKLKELWARDNAAVNRKIFSGGVAWSHSVNTLHGTWEVSYNENYYHEWKFKNLTIVDRVNGSLYADIGLDVTFDSPITLGRRQSGNYGLFVGADTPQNSDGSDDKYQHQWNRYFVDLYINGCTSYAWSQDIGRYGGGIFFTDTPISTLRIEISHFAVQKTSNYSFRFYLADGTDFYLNDRGSVN